MWDCLGLLALILASTFKPRARLEAEVIVLRHQLNVLRRAAPKRPKLTNLDRLIFAWLYRLFPSVSDEVTVVRPETIVRRHRGGFRLDWRRKSRFRDGRPQFPEEVRRLIRETTIVNPLWGASRIHREANLRTKVLSI